MNYANIRKELECLYSWFEFYKVNQNYSQAEKTQSQIKEFQTKHNIK